MNRIEEAILWNHTVLETKAPTKKKTDIETQQHEGHLLTLILVEEDDD